MAKRAINLAAIEGAIKSSKTPAPLKKGLIKKYGKKLGLTRTDIKKYTKATGVAKKVARKVKAKKNPRKKAVSKNPTSSGQYIVTALDRNKGMRATISKPMSKAQAEKFKKGLEVDMKVAAPSYRWASAIKVEKVKKNPGKHPRKSKAAKENPQVAWMVKHGTKADRESGKFVGVIGIETPVKAFTIARKTGFTSRAKAMKWTKDALIKIEEKLKSGKWDGRDKALMNPPRTSGTTIYDRITAIEATKGKKSLWPKEDFRHDFKVGGKIIGLPNGDLLVKKGKDGKPLWRNFKYGDEDGTRKNPVKGKTWNLVSTIKKTQHMALPKAGQAVRYLLKVAHKQGTISATKLMSALNAQTQYKTWETKTKRGIVNKTLQLIRDAKEGNPKSTKRSTYYVGYKGRNKPKICSLKNPPTKASHGKRFTRMAGPFKSRKAAQEYAAKH